MQCLIILSAVIVAVTCQWAAPRAAGYRGDPSLARILSDQRAHHVAGDFRLAVQQEDGTKIEEQATSADGTRRGQYSYINDLGKTETVKWQAGPGGFEILGQNNQPAHTQHTAAWHAAADNLAREHAAANARAAEAARRAALNPKPVEQYSEKRAHHRPAQYTAPKQYTNTQYQHTPQQYRPAPVHRPVPVHHYQPVQYTAPTTPAPVAPKRFFPPGQLSFSRNQLGYQYDFSS